MIHQPSEWEMRARTAERRLSEIRLELEAINEQLDEFGMQHTGMSLHYSVGHAMRTLRKNLADERVRSANLKERLEIEAKALDQAIDREQALKAEHEKLLAGHALVPIAHCQKCGAPFFTSLGFCGGCGA